MLFIISLKTKMQEEQHMKDSVNYRSKIQQQIFKLHFVSTLTIGTRKSDDFGMTTQGEFRQ